MAEREMYFVRAEGVTEKPVGQSIALYVEAHRSIHVLNPTAHFIWESLKEPLTFDELLFVLGDAFNVERGTLQHDLHATLAELTELGLLLTRTAEDGRSLS